MKAVYGIFMDEAPLTSPVARAVSNPLRVCIVGISDIPRNSRVLDKGCVSIYRSNAFAAGMEPVQKRPLSNAFQTGCQPMLGVPRD